MLHAYELGALSEEEERKIEVHFIECRHCFAELKRYAERAEFLSRDEEAKTLIAEIVADRRETRSPLRRLAAYLWPSAPIIFRPALLYTALAVAVLLLVYSTERYSPAQEALQSIELPAIRLPEAPKLEKQDGWAALVIESPFTDQGERCAITIAGPDKSVIYQNSAYRGFTGDQDLGVIFLNLTDLKRGRYRLTIKDLSDSLRSEHIFLIE
jgi:hypothetical protein